MRLWIILLIGLLAVLVLSCAGGDNDSPVTPDDESNITIQTQSNSPNRVLWGFWDVTVDPNALTATVTPVRTTSMHMNIISLIETYPCANCLTISNIHTFPPDELRLNLNLTHLIAGNLKLCGFDVRGIFITGSDYYFPSEGKYIARGDSLPRLYNHDGYTSIFNPTDYSPSGPGPDFLKYIPGKFAKEYDLSSTLNPFLAYSEDQTRRIFLPGETISRTVILKKPPAQINFGYAVDACWEKVIGSVTNPQVDFPPEANCLEPYKIILEVETPTGSDVGTDTDVTVEVYDHQGFDWVPEVFVEAPDLFDGSHQLLFYGETFLETAIFKGTIENAKGAPEGTYPIIAKVIDHDDDPNLGAIMAWQVADIRIGNVEGWVKTWGGPKRDTVWDMTFDENENLYTVGKFSGTVDFDPGPETDMHTAVGSSGAFLSKFTNDGEFLWAKTWGPASAIALMINDSGNPNVTGEFSDTCDFDPGDGITEVTVDGLGTDIFVTRFDSDGNFQWVRTWGAANLDDFPMDIASAPMGSLYLSGSFQSTVDFDPSVDTETRTSNGHEDAFLLKLDYAGDLEWVNAWGGVGGVSFSEDDEANSIALVGSSIIVGGNFHTEVDFDPGPGEELVTPNGYEDSYLIKFSQAGNFQWVKTFGGINATEIKALCTAENSDVLAVGFFTDVVDFDPGDGVNELTAIGSNDGFVSRYDSDGNLKWAVQVGRYAPDVVRNVTVDSTGDIIITGFFQHTTDLDPGPGIDYHLSEGWIDALLVKLDSTGIFEWGRSFGGPGTLHEYIDDEGVCVLVDSTDRIYCTGHFEYPTDFEPGPGEDTRSSNGLWDCYLSRYHPNGMW